MDEADRRTSVNPAVIVTPNIQGPNIETGSSEGAKGEVAQFRPSGLHGSASAAEYTDMTVRIRVPKDGERRGEDQLVSGEEEGRGLVTFDPAETTWRCSCGGDFLTTLKDVARHVTQRHANGKMTFSCSGCRKFNSETARSLPSHGRYCRGPATIEASKSFPCSLCSSSFDSKSGHSQHIRVKHPEA